MIRLTLPTLLATLLAGTVPAAAQTAERLSVIANGEKVGSVAATRTGDHVAIHYEVKNNGRSPTMDEAIDLAPDGLPRRWTLDGKATFGGGVRERFGRDGATARWSDAMGMREASVGGTALYIGQSASPWALGLYARALLKAPGGTLPGLPGGQLHIDPLGPAIIGTARYQAYAISGIDLSPEMILLDAAGALFAVLDTGGATVREGHEAEPRGCRLHRPPANRPATPPPMTARWSR